MLASQWVWQRTKSVSIPAEEQNAGRVVDYFYRMEFHITPRFFSDSNYLFFFEYHWGGSKKAKNPFFKCVLYLTYVLYSNYLVYSAPPSKQLIGVILAREYGSRIVCECDQKFPTY